MLKKLIFSFTIIALTTALATPIILAQGNNSPFLITGKLAHLTKLLMQQWDNPELNLSTGQKDKLIVIRKKTISGVRTLSPSILALQKQITNEILSGKDPKELEPKVKKLANMKAEATMIHLECIYMTNAILDKDQLALLTNRQASPSK